MNFNSISGQGHPAISRVTRVERRRLFGQEKDDPAGVGPGLIGFGSRNIDVRNAQQSFSPNSRDQVGLGRFHHQMKMIAR